MASKNLIFRQLFDYTSYTYTYILADAATREAVIIDPVYELVDRDMNLAQELDLIPVYVLSTHVHADHVTGTYQLKQKNGKLKSIISNNSGAMGDMKVKDGEVIRFGGQILEIRETPGHTQGCISFVLHQQKMAFTGDTLLIRGCGRTDFQEGNADQLYDSVWDKLLSLPDDYKLYPAHDYTGQTVTTVGEEKKHNRRLTKGKADFVNIMMNLNLPYPKQIDRALPANMAEGFIQ